MPTGDTAPPARNSSPTSSSFHCSFVVLALIGMSQVAVDRGGARVFGATLAALTIVLAYRAMRMGTVTVTDDELRVRNFLRIHYFPLIEIRRVTVDTRRSAPAPT